MDNQLIFNAAAAIIGALAMFVLKAVYAELANLKDTDKSTQDKLHHLETHIAAQYVKREDLREEVGQIFAKFDRFCENFGAKIDRLSEKLDKK